MSRLREHSDALRRRVLLFLLGLLSMAVLALGLTILLQLAAIYLPFLQTVLKTVPPSPMEWLVIAVASLAPALLVELYKLRRFT
ncbi:MAG: cation-translocating P-type ATPase C-terminal domain-containing protein [Chloroflexota bacterium]